MSHKILIVDDSGYIATANDNQFRKLCDVLGAPHLAIEYPASKDRVLARSELTEKLHVLTRKFTRSELLPKLDAVFVPAGPINTLVDVFDDPHVKHRRMKLDIPNAFAKAGSIPGIRTPIVVDGQHQHRGQQEKDGRHAEDDVQHLEVTPGLFCGRHLFSSVWGVGRKKICGTRAGHDGGARD